MALFFDRRSVLVAIPLLIAAYFVCYSSDLATNPQGFFCDEASIAYNAYSIATTGKDEHGNSFPLFFKAFGEYKSAPYIYALSALQLITGMNEWSSRFVAFVGVLAAVAGTALLLLRLWGPPYALAVTILLLTEPWIRHFSHVAFELTLTPLFIIAALLAGERFIMGKGKQVVSAYCLITFTALACYNYPPSRLVTPLLLLGTTFIFRRELHRRICGLSPLIRLSLGGLFLLLVSPYLFIAYREGEQFFSRASLLSIFNAAHHPNWAWRYLASIELQPYLESTLGPLLVFLLQYGAHYDPHFLFVSGDVYDRFTLPGWGPYLPTTAVWLLLGLGVLCRRRQPADKVLLLWFLLLGLPGSLTWDEVPHVGRAATSLLAIDCIAAVGLVKATKTIWAIFSGTGAVNARPVGAIAGRASAPHFCFGPLCGITLTAVLLCTLYGSIKFNEAWQAPSDANSAEYRQYGYRELFQSLQRLRPLYAEILLAPPPRMYQPYIFTLFYTQWNPALWHERWTLPWNITVTKYPLSQQNFAPGMLVATGALPKELPDNCSLLETVATPQNDRTVFRIIGCESKALNN